MVRCRRAQCTDDEIGIHTLVGDYEVNRRRRGPKIYKKVGGDPVFLYYWDTRDGENFSGWWFGPTVGGDLVWAHNPSNADTPPRTGWRIPWNGEVTPGLLIVDRKEDTPNNEDPSSGSDNEPGNIRSALVCLAGCQSVACNYPTIVLAFTYQG